MLKNKNMSTEKQLKHAKTLKKIAHDRYVNSMINYLDLNHWLPDRHGINDKNLKKFLW